MAWNGLTLTTDGRSALTQAQIEKKITFKSIVIGDGEAPQNFNTMKNLVHQLYEITEIMIDVTGDRCTLTADFPTFDYGYYFREVGIIVSTEDGNKLYVYDNCGDDAQYLAVSGVEKTKKRIRLSLKISDVDQIVIENPEILYVSYDDFENLGKTVEGKVTSAGGDVADTKISQFAESEESYPVPTPGDTLKTVIGKLIKFCNDIKTGLGKKANSDHTHPAATAKASGLMSATDKAKLDGIAEKANNYSHPITAGNKHIPAGGSSGQILRWSADGTAAWGSDNNTTYSNMTAATASAAGKAGLVPAPAAGAQGKYLRGDGTWQTPPDTNTTYGAATQNAAGLMSAGDKKKLDGVAAGANNYSFPSRYPNSTFVGGASSCVASGKYAFSFGDNTTASATGSFALGRNIVASNLESFVCGYNLESGADWQVVFGSNNAKNSNGRFIIGNGGINVKSNAFRVARGGEVYAQGAYNASGADYAEFFEWLDENPEAEDRRGYFVALDGDKICIANSDDDYILGIISGRPSVIGNSDPDDWHGHFLTDEFGDFIMEKTIEKRKTYREEGVEETYLDEDGTEKVRLVPKMIEDEIEVEVDSYVLNPDYDPDKPYVPRAERKEWAAVGMLGVLLVRDDGTCQVNGYCQVADGGIATVSETGWRVIARVNEHLVKIVYR